MDCDCDACKALAAEYDTDPQLLRHYRNKLLVKGWAGRTSPTEKAYILAHSPWAQHAAEVGRANLDRRRAHVSNPHIETAQGEGAVLPHFEGENGPLYIPKPLEERHFARNAEVALP